MWLMPLEYKELNNTALLLADIGSEKIRVTLWQTEKVQNFIGYCPIRTLSDVNQAPQGIGE